MTTKVARHQIHIHTMKPNCSICPSLSALTDGFEVGRTRNKEFLEDMEHITL